MRTVESQAVSMNCGFFSWGSLQRHYLGVYVRAPEFWEVSNGASEPVKGSFHRGSGFEVPFGLI